MSWLVHTKNTSKYIRIYNTRHPSSFLVPAEPNFTYEVNLMIKYHDDDPITWLPDSEIIDRHSILQV